MQCTSRHTWTSIIILYFMITSIQQDSEGAAGLSSVCLSACIYVIDDVLEALVTYHLSIVYLNDLSTIITTADILAT